MQARLKICGLTRKNDVDAAVRAGAWAVGVIFTPESPRRVEIDAAAAMLDDVPCGIMRVGVFVNATAAEIDAAVAACDLKAVQLHGEETPGFCREVKERLGAVVIKALRVSGIDSLDGVVQFDTDYILLDTYHPGMRGGTGETFDWSLAAELPAEVRSSRIILSGGLRADNIAAAYEAVAPYALDVSSGIESSPGIKDHSSLERLFAQIDQ